MGRPWGEFWKMGGYGRGWRALAIAGGLVLSAGPALAQDGDFKLPSLSELLKKAPQGDDPLGQSDKNADPLDIFSDPSFLNPDASTAPVQPTAPSQSALMTPAEVYKTYVRGIGRVIMMMPTAEGLMRGVGTGFVVDAQGHMVTNCHVVDEGGQATGPVTYEVEFPDDEVRLPATVLGCDIGGDIAVLQVDGLDASRPVLRFAEPGTYGEGDTVVAIGYARDFYGNPSISDGTISGMRRSLENSFSDLIQTDADINHGNSGGPLINMRGEVVGVNTYTTDVAIDVHKILKVETSINDATATDTLVHADVEFGIYYARSSLTAQNFADQIINRGYVNRLNLGIDITSFDSQQVRFPRLAVQVSGIIPGTLAEQLGIQVGDFIYAFEWPNGFVMKTTDLGAWSDATSFVGPGDTVKIKTFTLTPAGFDAAVQQMRVGDADVTFREVEVTPEQSTLWSF